MKACGKIKKNAGTEGLFPHQEVSVMRLTTVPPFQYIHASDSGHFSHT